MKYQASLSALLFPEKLPPMFKPAREYTDEMVAVEAARLSYFKFERDALSRAIIESSLAMAGYDHVEFFSGKEHGGQAVAALQIAGNDALIVFRGTQPNDITDVATDLDIARSPWPEGGTVHSGFRTSFEELWSDVHDWQGRTAGRHKVIAGHSLGSGLATLCATRFDDRTLVTIGSSRVGDAAFASLLNGVDIRRFVGCCDVVTSLPPHSAGFRHVGRPRYLDRNGTDLGDAPPEVIAADREHARLDYLVKFSWRIGDVGLRDLADHAPINYVSAILGEREA
jgi:triacylglycerol lipase